MNLEAVGFVSHGITREPNTDPNIQQPFFWGLNGTPNSGKPKSL